METYRKIFRQLDGLVKSLDAFSPKVEFGHIMIDRGRYY